MAYKTPGVFVEEISTFPPSVVPVATAVPAFIGYTETAREADDSTLLRVPKRIKSLLEFEAFFGGPFEPASYNVNLDIPGGNAVGTVSALDDGGNPRSYYLYNSLRHYFANGGGPCFIVSVGLYPAPPALGSATADLRGGLTPIRSLDAPTLLLFPDGVSLDDDDLGSLQRAALTQCADLQDRFTLMDLPSGRAPPGIGVDPAQVFRPRVGTGNLRYGAAYYPWVRSIYKPDVHFRELAFRTPPPANAAIADAAIDGLADAVGNALVTDLRTADTAVDTIVSAVDVSAWTAAAPVTITRRNFRQMLTHYAALTDAIRQLPTPLVPADVIENLANLVILPRALALGLEAIRTAALAAPEITQTVDALTTDTGVQGAINALVALEKHAALMPLVAVGRDPAAVDIDYASLNGTGWFLPPATDANDISPNTGALAGADEREIALSAAAAIETHFETLAAAILAIFDVADFLAAGAETRLFAGHEVMKAVREQVQASMSLLPPSGGIAGVYSSVDRTRGVWKAPANVSLADIIGPVVKVNDQAQADLNVHSSGKSINAIRSFAGQGTLVWGARTLAGNDNEWRYINVRRFFNMAEESIKKASEPFTFEPNDANTWVRVRAMIENFLTLQWRQGALMGATAQKAFFVKIGLGETMTAEDILEGRMIVEIGMAVVRPAEFIILKFAHKMQVS